MNPIRHTKRLWICCLALATLATFQSAPAQTHTSKVSVPDDLVVRQHLSRARDALTQGDTARAITIWQEVLDRMSAKVVASHRAPRTGTETDAVIDGDRFHGVRSVVIDLIQALPTEGLARYRAIMEPKARRMLGDGIARENEALLRECALRYALTPSGRAAHLALVDLLIEHGRFEEARVTIRRLHADLADAERTSSLGLQVLAREGLTLWGSGRKTELTAMIAESRAAAAGQDIAVDADQVDVIAFLEALLAQTEEPDTGDRGAHPAIRVTTRGVWNRSFMRNTRSAGRSRVFGSRSQPQWITHYPVIPSIADGVVYYCDGRFIRARSLFSGHDIWPGVASPLPDFSGRQNRNLYYHVVIDDDLLFGYLEGPPAMEAGDSAWQGFRPIETIPSHKLVAVDRNTGDVRWSHLQFAAEDPADAAFLSKLCVNQPPLVIGDTLYAAGHVLMGVFHQWLCAFDRSTGQLKWRTYTGAGQMELNMFGNPVKEAVPGHVTEDDGVLYYSNNIGVICAVDAVNGTIIWEAAYEQEPIPSTDSPMTRERQTGWMPSAPAVVGDRVFVAPTDSRNLYACDVKTGALTAIPVARRTTRDRNHYFLGAHGGLLLVAGNRVIAIDPKSLKGQWTTIETGSRFNGSSIQGLPEVVGDSVIFCTSVSTGGATVVNEVDLRSGKYKRQERLRYASREGNIVADAESILIAGEHSIHAYFNLKDVERQLEIATRGPNPDPSIQMRLADVRKRQGQWAQALETYARALKRATSQGPRGRNVASRAALSLYNGWMEVAEEPDRKIMGGPSSPEGRFRKAMEYARTDRQRVRALLACLNWSLTEEDTGAFKRTIEDLVTAAPDEWVELRGAIHGLFPEFEEGLRAPAGLLAHLAAGVRAERANEHREAVRHFHDAQIRYHDAQLERQSAWRYAGDRIAKIMKVHGAGAYQVQERAAKRLLRAALSNDDMQGIRTILRNYPQSSVVERAYLELSRRLLGEGMYQEALGEMQRYFTRFARTSPAALYEYARCLKQLGARDSYAGVLQALAFRHGTETLKVDDKTVRVAGWTKRELAREETTSKGDESGSGLSGGLRIGWKLSGQTNGTPVRILDPHGRPTPPNQDLVLAHIDSEVVALTPKNGEIIWRKAAIETPKRAVWHDGALIMDLDQDVACLDPRTGDERWRTQPRSGDLRDLACGHGKVYMLVRSVAQGGLVIRGLDIASGQDVQARTMRGFYDGSFSVSPSWLLVRTPRQRKATCFDGFTGERVGNVMHFSRDGYPPFLTSGDHAILTFGSDQTTSQMVRVLARDPSSGEDAWEFSAGRGRFLPLALTERELVFELGSSTARSRNSKRHKVIVLDLETGKARFKTDLDKQEFSVDAHVRGDRLYVGVMATVKTGDGIAQKIRAYDLRKGTSPWATAEFAGANIRLSTHPTKDWVLVRKFPPKRRRNQNPHSPELYFINAKTGRVDDLIDLIPDSYRPDSVETTTGPTVRDGVLVLSTGTELNGWVK